MRSVDWDRDRKYIQRANIYDNNTVSVTVTSKLAALLGTDFYIAHALTPTEKLEGQFPACLPEQGIFGLDFLSALYTCMTPPRWRLEKIVPHEDKHYKRDPGMYHRFVRHIAEQITAVAEGITELTGGRKRAASLLSNTRGKVQQALSDVTSADEGRRKGTYQQIPFLLLEYRRLLAVFDDLLNKALLAGGDLNVDSKLAFEGELAAVRQAAAQFKYRLIYPESDENSYNLNAIYDWDDRLPDEGEERDDLEPAGHPRPNGHHGPCGLRIGLRLGRSFRHMISNNSRIFLLPRPEITTVHGGYGEAFPRRALNLDCDLILMLSS